MTEVSATGTPSSFGAAAVAIGFVAANLLLTPPGTAAALQAKLFLTRESRTYSADRDPFADMIQIPREHTSLIEFYAGLLLEQEPLGSEFAQVLFDNAWDLYAR